MLHLNINQKLIVLIALLSILLLVLICSIFVQTITRKRRVDYLLPQLNKQIVQRNKEIEGLLHQDMFKSTGQLAHLKKIKQLLNQSINDEVDLAELMAIEQNFNKYYNALICSSVNNEQMELLFEGRLLANLKFSQKTQEFNSAATYHNNSVKYFPTKLIAQLLGYKVVPLLNTNSVNDFKQWKATHLPMANQIS